MYIFPNTTAGWMWAHQHSNRADCSFLAYVGRSNSVRRVTYIDDEDAVGNSGRIVSADLYRSIDETLVANAIIHEAVAESDIERAIRG